MLFSIVIYKIAYDLKFYKTTPFYLHFVNTFFLTTYRKQRRRLHNVRFMNQNEIKNNF